VTRKSLETGLETGGIERFGKPHHELQVHAADKVSILLR
jgi:hypothetical protein